MYTPSDDSIAHTFTNLNLHDPPRASHPDSSPAVKINEASTTIDPNHPTAHSKTSSKNPKVPLSSMYEHSTPNGLQFVHAPYQYQPHGYPYPYYGMPPIPHTTVHPNLNLTEQKPVSRSEPASPSMYPTPTVFTTPSYYPSFQIPFYPTLQQPPVINHYCD